MFLQNLRQLLTDKTILRATNPTRARRITLGLHQLQSAIFIVQCAVLLGLVLGLWLTRGTTERLVSVSGWFLIIGLALSLLVAGWSELAYREEPSFAMLLRWTILNATSSSIPIMLAGLAWLFEGLTVGVGFLTLGSVAAFFVSWQRLELLAMLVPQQQNESTGSD